MAGAAEAIDVGRTALKLVEVAELQEVRDPVVLEAYALTIRSQVDLEQAGAFLTERIKPILKKIAESCDPVVAAAHSAHKAATAQRNALQQPLLLAESTVKQKISEYLDEQEKIRRAEIARQEALRRQAEEAERARIAEENRLARVAAEEEQLRRAVEAEAAGDTGEAARVLEAPVIVPTRAPEPAPMPMAPPPPTPAKVAGVSARVTYKAEVTNLLELVRDIAAGRAPISLVQVNQSKLDQQVRSLDGQVSYAGVRVYTDRVVSARAR